ncbi:HD-GYP domain-containing protein [Fusibacter bizertensis]
MIKSEPSTPWKVLVVDDDRDIHEITELALKRLVFDEKGLKFIHAYSASEAKIKMIDHNDIAVALLDVVMEEDTAGLDLVRFIREEFKNDSIRLILRTGNPGLAPEESVTLQYDINDYRGKTELTAQSLKTAIITALRAYKSIVTIQNLNCEIDQTQRELIYTLGEIAESRGIGLGRHVERVGRITALLAEKMNFPFEQLEHIRLGASMHDIGKMAINDNILNKPGLLTAEEFEQMKKHCDYGYEILKNSDRDLLKTAAIIAYEHHENYDSTGYPRGLKGDEIHLISRIVALVDVFDALATKRVYKEIWPQDKILSYIKSQSGLKFDPKVVNVFFENIDVINELIQSIETEN